MGERRGMVEVVKDGREERDGGGGEGWERRGRSEVKKENVDVIVKVLGREDGWMNGWMDGGMDGGMDGWMEGWMDGWRDVMTIFTYIMQL